MKDDIITPFLEQTRALLMKTAAEKGYHSGNLATYQNELMSFVDGQFGYHSLGEIVYKCIRYKSKKDPSDLVKIAAWAALVWLNDGHGAAWERSKKP